MNKLADKIQQINKRWKIQDNDTYENEFLKFKQRLLNDFSDIDFHITKEGISEFCRALAVPEQYQSNVAGSKWSTIVIDQLQQETNEKNFYKLIEIVFALPILHKYGPGGRIEYSKEILLNKVQDALEYSQINLAITVSNKDEVILFPAGEKKLDKQLVDSVLSFLDEHSSKHFTEALKKSLNKSTKDNIIASEHLRRSIEEYLRYKFNNNIGLVKNIKKLQEKLKKDGKDPNLRNIIFQTFNYLDQFFNENCKHKDGEINAEEMHFLIYQTGLLLTYINQVIS